MKGILAHIYLMKHPDATENDIPYWYRRSIIGEIWHLIRKKICVVWAPNCTITPLRIALYRLCGFKIGKGTFIGMKCYLDDLCVHELVIGEHVTISYGVYFACHGVNQAHNKITIRNNAYIGMRASIIAPEDVEIGEGAIIGAQTLVNKSVPAHQTAVGVPCRIIDKQ
jgi:acetyltransferase-like isoleucine patch superfamily enzyme